jgi:hypothetical protein
MQWMDYSANSQMNRASLDIILILLIHRLEKIAGGQNTFAIASFI